MLRCIDAYWAKELGNNGLHSAVRMGRVFEVLAAEIRTWAPDPQQAKICHLAINEIANRILEHAGNPKSQPASSGNKKT